MNDELENKIKQIAELLRNKDEMPDSLKSLLELARGNNGDKSPSHDVQESNRRELADDDTMELMMKLKKIMESKRIYDDPKIRLLNSIKPFLRESRQQKVNNCIKVLSLSKFTRYMDLLDKNG